MVPLYYVLRHCLSIQDAQSIFDTEESHAARELGDGAVHPAIGDQGTHRLMGTPSPAERTAAIEILYASTASCWFTLGGLLSITLSTKAAISKA